MFPLARKLKWPTFFLQLRRVKKGSSSFYDRPSILYQSYKWPEGSRIFFTVLSSGFFLDRRVLEL